MVRTYLRKPPPVFGTKPLGFASVATVETKKPARKKGGRKKKPEKDDFECLSKEPGAIKSDALLSEDNTTASPITLMDSPEFNFVGRTRKEDTFDKLFTTAKKQPNSVATNGNFTSSGNSSSEVFHSVNSNSGKHGELFQSFRVDDDDSCQGQRKKGAANKQKLYVPASKPTRTFSDDTLNYVVDELDKVHCSESVEEHSKEASVYDVSVDMFAHSVEEKMGEKVTMSRKRYLPTSPGFLSFLHSPAIGQQATSTPTIGATTAIARQSSIINRVEYEQENCRSDFTKEETNPKIVFAQDTKEILPLQVIVKGGKNWRRSVIQQNRRNTVAVGLNRKSSGHVLTRLDPFRRVTQQPNVDIVSEDFEEEEEVEEAQGILEKWHLPHCRVELSLLDNSLLNRSCLSSSYIVPSQEAIDKNASQLLTEPTVSDVEKVLSRCNEHRVVPFDDLFSQKTLTTARKVGEGAYGEVFLLDDGRETDPPVVKIVPVEGSVCVSGQPQTQLTDMLAEIVISTELSRLGTERNLCQCFLSVRKCSLTQGCYPDGLLAKWDEYHEEKISENDRPDTNLFKGQQQKFVVLELNNGGQDLENVVLNNASQGLSLFLQVAHALAVAEEVFQFEHRDLHWGNVLVRDCQEKRLEFVIGPDTFHVDTMGTKATIIDFSLSRMTSPDDGCDIYNNLAEDEDLFNARGDYQFDIYRMMRDHTYDHWRGFYPKTNVFWLHYMLDKLQSDVFYKNKKSRLHRSALAKIRSLKSTFIDEFESSYQFVCWAKENI